MVSFIIMIGLALHLAFQCNLVSKSTHQFSVRLANVHLLGEAEQKKLAIFMMASRTQPLLPVSARHQKFGEICELWEAGHFIV